MGNVAAIAGVVLLLLGVAMLALRGNRGSMAWVPFIGMTLAVAGLGVELIGAALLAS